MGARKIVGGVGCARENSVICSTLMCAAIAAGWASKITVQLDAARMTAQASQRFTSSQ
jgi:hypothetical protein